MVKATGNNNSVILFVVVADGMSSCQRWCGQWACQEARCLSLVNNRQAKGGVVEQATTILFLTLEVDNSKAKSEGIQI